MPVNKNKEKKTMSEKMKHSSALKIVLSIQKWQLSVTLTAVMWRLELSTKDDYKGNMVEDGSVQCVCTSLIPQHGCWPLCSWQGGGSEGLGQMGLLEREDGPAAAPWSSLSLWCGPTHPKRQDEREWGRTQL